MTPTEHPPAISSNYSNPEQHFFSDLIAAAQLIRLSWPDSARFAPSSAVADLIARHVAAWTALRENRSPGRRVRDAWAAPKDPAECGALLLAADTLLGGRGQDDLALRERIQPLATAAFTRNEANTGAAFRRMDVSPDLSRALAQRSLGFNRAGGHHHARQHVPSRQVHFGIEHVPALLPEAWIGAHFGDLKPPSSSSKWLAAEPGHNAPSSWEYRGSPPNVALPSSSEACCPAVSGHCSTLQSRPSRRNWTLIH
ncbi:hypothetical protein [Streptomyces sp. NPDC001123]